MIPRVLLSTRGLTKHFSGLRAVEQVDFDLIEGEIRALIGPNGAGKTTFVGMLCGRIEPTSGSVFLDGEDVSRLPAHKRILMGMSYTFQITSIFSRLPVEENVALATRGRVAGGATEVDAAVRGALDRVGLLDRADQIAGDLSHGHQRLLELAMGLAQRPRLLILDEPTQGLADSEIETFKDIIRSVSQEASVLLIEHNMAVVMAIADKITVLNFGEVLAEGSPEEIHADKAVQAAYLGTAEGAA